MPAKPLIKVDLPAPLSPTSAVTFPGSTAKSTPFKTSTAPKDFSTPSNSITGNGAPIFTPIINLANDKTLLMATAPTQLRVGAVTFTYYLLS